MNVELRTKHDLNEARAQGAKIEYTAFDEDALDAPPEHGGWVATAVADLWMDDIEAGHPEVRLRALYPSQSA